MSQLISVKNLLAGLALSVLFTACSSSRKSASRVDGPPPSLSKPTPEKKPENKKETAKAAPFNVPAFAREVKKPTYNIALFAPLFLDSAFANSNDIPGRTMPRYVLPGLEFYEGAQLALDSLQQLGYNLKVNVYDTKGRQNVSSLINNKTLDATDLIIGSFSTPELKEVSDFAKKKEINLVSGTLPNDAGISDNPFLFIPNSTLRTHCEAIHNYVQEAFSNKNIVLLRRNTPFESRLAADFKASYDKMNNPKKSRIREAIWNESTTPEELSKYLLTDRPNIIIVTAFEESGVKSILRKLSIANATYPMQIFGMPTWDVLKLKDPEFKTLQVFYSSPYFNDKTDTYSRYLSEYFRRTYRARPSDMAYKGFDLTYYFVRLLHNNGVYFNGAVEASPTVITRFNFQPVYARENEQIPSYFENKNIFIIQKGDSVDVKMNQ
ncbi:substrate-binding protein [Chitinophaga eiseniae]|uniref:Substrate-binding protein n=1 Tax=Chitinophaga eiseniae TaxID=634771 RepID=A0A1T4Q4P2_9BACT|nr:ABC transporter substrate-binding protein [Chitinophaga eiseniae]SJZ98732.1 substrate-binding protein [Chitinophaga eiseniae]